MVFGGMGHKPDSSVADDRVLNDVRCFDLTTRWWLPAAGKSTPNGNSRLDVPNAFVQYAHLSSVSANRLFVIGGQDLNNLWLDDVCVFDLVSHVWIHRREYPRHSGTHRSVAVSADIRVRFPFGGGEISGAQDIIDRSAGQPLQSGQKTTISERRLHLTREAYSPSIFCGTHG